MLKLCADIAALPLQRIQLLPLCNECFNIRLQRTLKCGQFRRVRYSVFVQQRKLTPIPVQSGSFLTDVKWQGLSSTGRLAQAEYVHIPNIHSFKTVQLTTFGLTISPYPVCPLTFKHPLLRLTYAAAHSIKPEAYIFVRIASAQAAQPDKA